MATAQLQAQWAFIGFHAAARDDLCFSKAHFHVEGLDRWLGLTGINVKLDLDLSGDKAQERPFDVW